ncbi:hypothetical protein [Ferrimonas marina]|uniref:Uncharacterized protein n=1 Tax=Ferrimonas marina TaxID=299255 RepID=A0A1M5TQ60_9GAMM|nr:hypothetical protein [Ferrimonas marina]SHH52902.1 hypothetical protein SAMN02745129_2236 [Ferrimonas marina]
MDIAFTTNPDTMYAVANIDNSEGLIKLMVYNNGPKSSELYGQFFFVTGGKIYTQARDGDGFVELEGLAVAFAAVSETPQWCAECFAVVVENHLEQSAAVRM